MITSALSSLPLATLLFAAGAASGRGLAALTMCLARDAGLPFSRYYALADGSRLSGVPIIGHFMRPRGSRCRRLLVMEWAGGLAFVACWALFPPAKAACGALFLLALLGASFIDLDHLIIPDLFSAGLAALGIALSAFVPALHGTGPFGPESCLRSAAAGFLGLAIGSSILLWFALLGEMALGREVLGFGDVKFVGAIGAFCGWQGAVFSVFGGAAVGALVIAAAAAQRLVTGETAIQLFRAPGPAGETGRLTWGAHFPFGPMLACAAALYFIALHPVVDRYLERYLMLF
jgi:leader peptidase (prepilin peptidase)/N-methyltransferase